MYMHQDVESMISSSYLTHYSLYQLCNILVYLQYQVLVEVFQVFPVSISYLYIEDIEYLILYIYIYRS